MSKRVEPYRLEVKGGDPPEKQRTTYDRKALVGALTEIAEEIKQGQHVEVPPGSLGKLKKLIRMRGLRFVTRGSQTADRAILYVPTDQWWDAHPSGR